MTGKTFGIRNKLCKTHPFLRPVYTLIGILTYSVSPIGTEILCSPGTESSEVLVAFLGIALSHRIATNTAA